MLAATPCLSDPAAGPRLPIPPQLEALTRPAPAPPARSFAPDASVPGDEYWWDGFGLPELDGVAYCSVQHGGTIVIGGHFTQIAGVPVMNIARWDGAGWSAVGDGLNGEVRSLAVYRGELIAGGNFDRSGTRTCRGIARWSGTAWEPLGQGLWYQPAIAPLGANALAARGDVLYAGGAFDHAGDVEARRVARWDGAAWSALGSGIDGEVGSLLALEDGLYVGGDFQLAGGLPARCIAFWNGNAWSDVGGGVSNATGFPRVLGMISWRGNVVAAGRFDQAGGTAARNIAAWNGSAWEPLGTPPSDGFEGGGALAVRGDKLFAGGIYLTEWDGTRWVRPMCYLYGWITTLLDTPIGLLAGGTYGANGNDGAFVGANIGILDDGGWIDPFAWTDRMHGLKHKTDFTQVDALTAWRGSVVAAGYFAYTGSASGRLDIGNVARWDGATWISLVPSTLGSPKVLLADGPTLYAGGAFQGPRGWSPVVKFSGDEWSYLDTLSVSARSLAVFEGRLYAGGWPLWPGARNGVYRWNGTRWENAGPVTLAGDVGSVYSLLVYQGKLIAAGRFDAVNGMPARSIAAWDGSRWSAMDDGLASGMFTAFETCGGTLYAGGAFVDSQGRSANFLRWAGSRWEAVPGPAGWATPWALACSGGRLFAGGRMLDANGEERGITSWDGAEWKPLGSGTNGEALSMLVHDGQLYVSGHFNRAGGKSSFGIARWDLRSEEGAAASALRSSVPNPFQATTTIAYRLQASARVEIFVHDLSGRRVATLESGLRPSGTHSLVWNGRDRDGRSVAAGIYFIQLSLGGRVESRRVVRLR